MVKSVHKKLLEHLSGGGQETMALFKSNEGKSLGHSVVTGGTHADRSKGISGSIHWNQNLNRKTARRSARLIKQSVRRSSRLAAKKSESELKKSSAKKKPSAQTLAAKKKKSAPKKAVVRRSTLIRKTPSELESEAAWQSLQREVIDMVRTVILETFGNTRWLKAAMKQYSAIPSERFLSLDLPCSHIWWTVNPRAFHAHVDTNTLPPAFVFCPHTVDGGDLVVLLPSGRKRVVKLGEGVVLGGSWAQGPHCNTPVSPSDDRRSFVVYMDKRVASASYKVVDKVRFD
jgi:hypothetical protein